MTGSNSSNKYYYRYKYFNISEMYTNNINKKKIKIDDKYLLKRYNYFFYYTNFIDNNNELSFESNNKLIRPPLPKLNTTLFISGSSIFGKKNSSTNTSSSINRDKSFNKIFNFGDFITGALDRVDKKIDEINKKPLPLEYTKEEKEYEFECLDEKIEDLEDLINLGKKYVTHYKEKKKRYNLNLRVLSDFVEPLQELNNMIGMQNIKESIFNKIILHLQNLDNKNTDYNHVVLCGSPGMGKTHVAKILGKIYNKIGFLSKGTFKEAKLTDLKAGYLGQTEIKTQRLLDEAKGGVLFFDEAYSLGSESKFDSYSQSVIDVINPYLDKYKDDFIMIIAGYKNDLEERFFRGNQGLRSRFGLWLEIPKYSASELNLIFKKKIKEYEWKYIESDISDAFFEKNIDYFKNFGRDMENLFSKCKLAHAKRVLFLKPEDKKIITKEDLKKGIEFYIKDTQSDLDKELEWKAIQNSIYM